MGINWTEVIIGVCTLIITSVLIPLINSKIKSEKNKLSQAQQETIEYWVEVGVRWAKQYLKSREGFEKKEKVLTYVSTKLQDLGIDCDNEDLNKIIEAIYERVKSETELIEVVDTEK